MLLAAALTSTSAAAHTPSFLRNNDVQNVLPVAPADYPAALQGMLWLDQTGAFGESSIPAGVSAPDLAISMGDTDYHRFDPATRTVSVSILGKAWQWQNTRPIPHPRRRHLNGASSPTGLVLSGRV